MRLGHWAQVYGRVHEVVPSLLTIAAMALSFLLLSAAIKTIPIGTAYAVWTGIGAIGVAILGMILFGESREILRIVCLVLIICGVVGLKLTSLVQGGQ